MTISELVAEYNSHGPVRPLKIWKGKKYDLFLRVLTAEKQSGADFHLVTERSRYRRST